MAMMLANARSGRSPPTGAFRFAPRSTFAPRTELKARLTRSFGDSVRSIPVLTRIVRDICTSSPSRYLLVANTVPRLPGSGNTGLTMFTSCWRNPSTRSVCS